MHLSETSLIKKYENDIGESIVDVGGDINHDNHWLPYLDNQIRDQLVANDVIDERIDEKLDERGLTPEAVAAWNAALEDIQEIESKPAMDITQEDIDAWNAAVDSLKGVVRFDEPQYLSESQKAQARDNIGIDDELYNAQWWNNKEN